jgi:hypothetical protein
MHVIFIPAARLPGFDLAAASYHGQCLFGIHIHLAKSRKPARVYLTLNGGVISLGDNVTYRVSDFYCFTGFYRYRETGPPPF